MGCHDDKSLEWSNEQYKKCYGEARKLHYGEIFSAGRRGNPDALTGITGLAEDGLLPPIVRATALSLLRNYPLELFLATTKKGLDDENTLVRYTAIHGIHWMSSQF